MKYAVVYIYEHWTVVPVEDDQARSLVERGIPCFDHNKIKSAWACAREKNAMLRPQPLLEQ